MLKPGAELCAACKGHKSVRALCTVRTAPCVVENGRQTHSHTKVTARESASHTHIILYNSVNCPCVDSVGVYTYVTFPVVIQREIDFWH